MSDRWRWRVWGWLCKLPGICPANAHSMVFHRGFPDRQSPRVDSRCRRDLEANGSCWCGKLTAQPKASA